MPELLWTDEEFQAAARRLDELVREFENLPQPEISAKALELLQAVDTLHREGIGRLIRFVHEQGHVELILRAAHDPVVHALLMLYDFVPGDETEAPGAAAPAPAKAAGFVAADELFAPMPAGPAGRQPRRPVFENLAPVEAVAPGTMQLFEAGGVDVLVANVAGELFAVRNACPAGGAPLNLGVFTPPVVVCPWHNEPYDVRSGQRLDGQPGPNLAVLPITIRDGQILLATDTLGSGATVSSK